MSRERGILFSAPMVRAILEGRKTVTRRVVNRVAILGAVTEFGRSDTPGYDWHCRDRRALWNDLREAELLARCPYGEVGDRLYVRETFAIECDVEGGEPPHADGRPVLRRPEDDVDGWLPLWQQPHYRATDPAPDLCCDRPSCAQCRDNDYGPHWKPAIHMPRWASRITLEVTAVRVERLQDISEAQARAEGSQSWMVETSAIPGFTSIWDRLASPGIRWADNPWVWCVSFKRIEKEVPSGGS